MSESKQEASTPMNREAVDDLTANLVRDASAVLERFQSGYHPSESQLKRLECSLFPFVGEKLCGHKIVESCECDEEIKR